MNSLIDTFFWASAISLAAPLLLGALGETFAQRAGMFTIGLEGLMLSGAFVAVAGSIWSGSLLVGLLLAIGVTALLGAAYAVAIVGCRADQVVVGIGFNLVALGVTSILRRQWFPSGMTAPRSDIFSDRAIPLLSDIPWLGAVLFDQNPLVYALYLVVPLCAYILHRTRVGLLVRAAGDGAAAAESAGISVVRVRFVTMTINGAFAGAAGAALVLIDAGGVFVDNIVDGRGYLVLALTMFARWKPVWVALGAVLFGAADALQFIGQAAFGENVPTAVFLMAPYLVALIAWAVMGNRSAAPSDLGKPLLR